MIGILPTHEIAILLFGFQVNLQFRTFGDDSSAENMVDSIMGKDLPEQESITIQSSILWERIFHHL